MKILISAYSCSPNHGSEPGVGWGFVKELSKKHDVHVITQEHEFKNVIKNYMDKNHKLKKRLHFYYVPRYRNPLVERIWPPSYYWSYRKWHKDAFKLAQKLQDENNYELVHQLNMVGFREPGYMWKLDIPFIWGPIGGMGLFPWKFLKKISVYGAIYYAVYNIFNIMQMKYYHRPRIAARLAGKGLITATRDNQVGAFKYWGCKSTILTEVGLPGMQVRVINKRISKEPLKIVWSGQHTYGKALNLGLESLSLLPRSIDWELNVLGNGVRTTSWQRLAVRLGIAENCKFKGWLSREMALDVMTKSHVVLITSLKDLTSTVTIEALSLGLPIVCLDHCGFSDVVTKECGIKISVTTPEQVVRDMAVALERLATEEKYRQRLARGALKRSKEFTWDKKIEVLNKIYRIKIMEKLLDVKR